MRLLCSEVIFKQTKMKLITSIGEISLKFTYFIWNIFLMQFQKAYNILHTFHALHKLIQRLNIDS